MQANLTRTRMLGLYKSLYKHLCLNKPAEENVYRILLRNEFEQNSVSDSKYCMEKDQMIFLANAYSTYLTSTVETLALYARYCKGERSIEESANIVGLRLPKQYNPSNEPETKMK